MLKKLATLSLALLLGLSLLPGQASAMDVPEERLPIQEISMEKVGTIGDAGAGNAPCIAIFFRPRDVVGDGFGGGIGAGDNYGSGSS